MFYYISSMSTTSYQKSSIHKLYNQAVLISSEEETKLFKLLQTERNYNKRRLLKDKLVKANIRFVISTALKYGKVHGNDMNDIIAEGMVGLSIAVERFNPDKGVKFISYAIWYINMRIKGYITSNELIRVPDRPKMKCVNAQMSGKELCNDDAYIYTILNNTLSIDTHIGEDDSTYADIIADESENEHHESYINQNYMKTIVNDLLDTLSLSDRKLIETIYNFDNSCIDRTEIANKIGVSCRRVCDIRKRIINTLRNKVPNIQSITESVALG